MSKDKKRKIEWTPELLARMEGNREPFGMLLKDDPELAEALKAAHEAGAQIRWWDANGWSIGAPLWLPQLTYSIAPGWTPPAPESEPAPEPDVDVVEVHGPDKGCSMLHYHRKNREMAVPWLGAALSDPDYIGEEWADGSRTCGLLRLASSQVNSPAEWPVRLYFRRSK